MTTAGTVQIPNDHFLKRVRNEYCDRQFALVREFVQNSVDAGATRIDIVTGPNSLTVTDDGRGILPERMIVALLTLGGTVKDGESVGGFGLAKELLLFCHESYEIRTLNSLVRGKVLSYTLETVSETFHGAEFNITFAPDFGYSQDSFRQEARDYLATCNLDAKIFVDGTLVDTSLWGRKTDIAFAYGKVMCRRLPEGETTQRVIVRVRGLTMFKPYVTSIGKQVIVELEGDARSLLSSNRDGLRHPASTDLSKLIAEMTVSPKSFDRARAQKVVFPGSEAQYFGNEEIERKAVAEGVPSPVFAAFVSQVASLVREGATPTQAVAQAVAQAQGTDDVGLVEKVGKLMLKEIEKNFATDFVVSIEGTDLRHPPKAMRPATMTKRYRQLAQLWQYMLGHVIKVNGISLNYRVGFCLDPEKVGYFSRQEKAPRGTPVDILLRPSHFLAIKNPKERYFAVLEVASHEVTHSDEEYHGETFTALCGKRFVKSLATLPPRAKVMRDVRRVKL